MTKVKQRRTGSSRATTGRRKTAKARSKTQSTRSKKSRGGAKSKRPVVVEPPRTVRVRILDPQAKCGAGTSVERLFRVDETTKGSVTTHLVFFDRHGLYCEHGRTCPAVDDVRRAHRNLDWTR